MLWYNMMERSANAADLQFADDIEAIAEEEQE